MTRTFAMSRYDPPFFMRRVMTTGALRMTESWDAKV
jgi:hypothetical protein